MGNEFRWDPCIFHRDNEARDFIREYFSESDRKILVVSAAGFDPRSCVISTLLKQVATKVQALFILENRPIPSQIQEDWANANASALQSTFPMEKEVRVEIFDTDDAIVGGRNIVEILSNQDLNGITDVIVDMSALSLGLVFPIVRYFVELISSKHRTINLHVFVLHEPEIDAGIRSCPSASPGYIHGFKGLSTLSSEIDSARLWLPQLASGQRRALTTLYDFIEPSDTCPILPFPASDPRRGDSLAREYLTELEHTWSVDSRNLVYADEGDPLDLYRTILRLDNLRKPVFSETGGSTLVLSPLGSKILALGALMAALERNLPVAHLEPISYEIDNTVPQRIETRDVFHIWLEGDAYPEPRPPLPASTST